MDGKAANEKLAVLQKEKAFPLADAGRGRQLACLKDGTVLVLSGPDDKSFVSKLSPETGKIEKLVTLNQYVTQFALDPSEKKIVLNTWEPQEEQHKEKQVLVELPGGKEVWKKDIAPTIARHLTRFDPSGKNLVVFESEFHTNSGGYERTDATKKHVFISDAATGREIQALRFPDVVIAHEDFRASYQQLPIGISPDGKWLMTSIWAARDRDNGFIRVRLYDMAELAKGKLDPPAKELRAPYGYGGNDLFVDNDGTVLSGDPEKKQGAFATFHVPGVMRHDETIKIASAPNSTLLKSGGAFAGMLSHGEAPKTYSFVDLQSHTRSSVELPADASVADSCVASEPRKLFVLTRDGTVTSFPLPPGASPQKSVQDELAKQAMTLKQISDSFGHEHFPVREEAWRRFLELRDGAKGDIPQLAFYIQARELMANADEEIAGRARAALREWRLSPARLYSFETRRLAMRN